MIGHDVAALSIYDSFLSTVSKADRLEEAMDRASFEVAGISIPTSRKEVFSC